MPVSCPEGVLYQLADMRRRAGSAESLEQLLGIEGTAAREYFTHFARMFKPGDDEVPRLLSLRPATAAPHAIR